MKMRGSSLKFKGQVQQENLRIMVVKGPIFCWPKEDINERWKLNRVRHESCNYYLFMFDDEFVVTCFIMIWQWNRGRIRQSLHDEVFDKLVIFKAISRVVVKVIKHLRCLRICQLTRIWVGLDFSHLSLFLAMLQVWFMGRILWGWKVF